MKTNKSSTSSKQCFSLKPWEKVKAESCMTMTSNVHLFLCTPCTQQCYQNCWQRWHFSLFRTTYMRKLAGRMVWYRHHPSSSQTFQDKMAKLLHIELTMHYYTSVTSQQNSRKATTRSNFFSLKPETLKLLSVSCILAKLELVLKLYIEASVSDWYSHPAVSLLNSQSK